MSEFKFACPVCGQHLTADSSTSGGQIECPTCFQKIVVPQAPESADTKLLLSAAQVGKPRPAPETLASQLAPLGSSAHRSSLPAFIGLLALLGAAGAAAFYFRDRIVGFIRPVPRAPAIAVAPAPPSTGHPVPTNFSWTLQLTNALFPDTPLAGEIHGNGFVCSTAVLVRGLLLCGEGAAPPHDLGFGVNLPARHAGELSGKTFEVPPDRTNAPPVGWRWKDEQHQPVTRIISNGYLLKVTFGQATNGHLPGRIYICMPDPGKSFAAGTFDAEIKQPPPPKPTPPTPPRPKD